ncbi:MAG: diguanylate cyclase, partial [Spirochaetia bacterium]|nr:diguanylate cyclase [Spirochaetia bacterium]
GLEGAAKRLGEILRQPFRFEDRSFEFSASLGCVLYPDDGDEIGDLMEKADAKMYEAKREYKKEHPSPR